MCERLGVVGGGTSAGLPLALPLVLRNETDVVAPAFFLSMDEPCLRERKCEGGRDRRKARKEMASVFVMHVMRVNTNSPNYPGLELTLRELVATHGDEQRYIGWEEWPPIRDPRSLRYTLSLAPSRAEQQQPRRRRRPQARSLCRPGHTEDACRPPPPCSTSINTNKSDTRPFRDRSCAT